MAQVESKVSAAPLPHSYYRTSPYQQLINQLLFLFKLADRILQVLIAPLPNRLSYFSTPDYGDNAYYLYRHALLTRNNLEHVWLVRDASHAGRIAREFDTLGGRARGHSLRVARRASLRGYWLYLTSRYVFHTHGVYRFVRWAFRRDIVCLWHGMPIKTVARLNRVSTNPFPTFGTRHIATSHFFRYVMASAFGVAPEKVSVCGLPRCDALRADYVPTHGRERIRRSLQLPEGSKLVLWMPTFRTEFGKAMPARSFLDDLQPQLLEALDRLAGEQGCTVIIKLHTYDVLNDRDAPLAHKNLRLLKAREWLEHGIPLYELIAASDALLSDISSVLIDYLVTARPIGIIGFDPNNYARGLVYPIEVLFRSRRFDVLSGEAAIEAFLRKIGAAPAHARNDIASMLYDEFALSGSEAILREAGVASGEQPRAGASVKESAL